MLRQCACNRRAASATPPGLQAAQVQSQVGGFVHRALDLPAGNDSSQVEHGACRCSDRDAVPCGELVLAQRQAVDHDCPASGGSERDGDVDARTPWGEQAPENGRAPVAQNGSWPERTHSSQEMAMERQLVAAHREHPSVHSTQPASPDPARDGSIAQAHFDELGAGHHPVLAGGERGQALIDS
jgi:hypothetical protein